MTNVTGKMTITRGQTVYEFEAQANSREYNMEPTEIVVAALSIAERWVFESPNRLSKLDETEKFRAAQPGDTVQMRTR